MFRPVLLLSTACAAFAASAQSTPDLALLANTMIGSYSSAAQAERDTNYFNIELEMVRIWPQLQDGIWLYVEQATAAKKEKPYRQRIYHLEQVDDSTFISTVCNLDSMKNFMGAYRDVSRFDGLRPIDAKVLEGCAITLRYRNGRFIGSTHESDCRNAWGKATYATSEVNIGPEGMVSWDRGYDDTHTQVWGAEKGGYEFVKKVTR